MLTCVGLLIGLAIGLTGVGGGVLTAPILILVFGVSAEMAVGTALLFSTCVKILSAGLLAAKRRVDTRVLTLLLIGGVPGALLGPFLMGRFIGAGRRPLLLAVVGATVACTAGYSLVRSRAASTERRERLRWLPWISFPIGLEVGFSSAGAGALGTVVLFNQTKLEAATVVGTDLVYGLVISGVASAMHMAAGHWDIDLLGRLLAGGILGAVAGANLATRTPARPLRALVLFWAVLLGAMLVWQGVVNH